MSEIPKLTAKPRGESLAKILEREGRATPSQLMKLTGRTRASIQDSLKTLHDKSKIHIGGYEVSKRGQVTRVWYWGDGDDTREPVVNLNKSVLIPHADVAAAWMRNSI
jgi:hypothetical protein